MAVYNISIPCFGNSQHGQVSEKAMAVMRMFGVTADRFTESGTACKCELEIGPGDIVYITGPSGAGKSVMLNALEKTVAACERTNLNETELAGDKRVIDCIEGDYLQGLKTLSVAGLNDVFCVLSEPISLSDGQRYRFRLAMALAKKKKFIFADEFCSNLDRICASAISYNVRKFARRTGITFILASSQEDILADLSPDVLVVKELSGGTEVIYK